MASQADELRAAMLARLRASADFSTGVGGRIFETPVDELPSAWIGVTASEEADRPVELMATVHVLKRAEAAEVKRLVEAAKEALEEAPEGLAIGDWALDYAEVRHDEEHSANRGLVRFRGWVGRG